MSRGLVGALCFSAPNLTRDRIRTFDEESHDVPSFLLSACSLLFVFYLRPGAERGRFSGGEGGLGRGHRWMNLTNQVRRLLNSNRVVIVNNDNMSGDPALRFLLCIRARL